MQILNNLISTIKTDVPIRKLRMGVHWTAVSSRFCGMASDEDRLYHSISQGAIFRQIVGVELITWEK